MHATGASRLSGVLLDEYLADCLAQAEACADERGVVEPDAAFALMRRAYGVGYCDALAEAPADDHARAVIRRAWEAAASCLAELVRRPSR